MNGLSFCGNLVSTYDFCWNHVVVDFLLLGFTALNSVSQPVYKNYVSWQEKLGAFFWISLYGVTWVAMLQGYQKAAFSGIPAKLWVFARIIFAITFIISACVAIYYGFYMIYHKYSFFILLPIALFCWLVYLYCYTAYLLHFIIIKKSFFEVDEYVAPEDDAYLKMTDG